MNDNIDYRKYFKSHCGGISDAPIVAFEQKLGVVLPSDYKEFLHQCNGGVPCCRGLKIAEKLGNRTIVQRFVGIDDPFIYGGLQAFVQPFLAEEMGPAGSIPIAYDDGANKIALICSGAKCGQIWYTTNDDKSCFLAQDLGAFFDILYVVEKTDVKLSVPKPPPMTRAEWLKKHAND